MHRPHQENKYVNLCAPLSIATGAAVTPIVVNGSGFDRIGIFATHGPQAGATKTTIRLTVYKSATSGGVYTKVTASDGTMASTASNKIGLIIDAAIDPDKPFMKVYGTGGGRGTSGMIVGLPPQAYRATVL